jgi:hypothetical protein
MRDHLEMLLSNHPADKHWPQPIIRDRIPTPPHSERETEKPKLRRKKRNESNG